MRTLLRARLGEDIFMSWFHTLEFEGCYGTIVSVSLPVKFLRTWIMNHYYDDLLACTRVVFKRAQRVEIVLRWPGRRIQTLQS